MFLLKLVLSSILVLEIQSSLERELNVIASETGSTKQPAIPQKPKILQPIRVPVRGPYCYPKMLIPVDETAAPPRITRYTPQLREESAEIMEPRYPDGIIENVWPYEPNQSKRLKENREYFRLNVSSRRYEDDYRLTGRAAERAFISRYYGFINASRNYDVDELISSIEDDKKMKNHYAARTNTHLVKKITSFSDQERSRFCDRFINHSTILFEQNIIYDSSKVSQIITTQIYLKYKNDDLLSFKETLDVVRCPCMVDTSNGDGESFELGVLPIEYKYKNDLQYAFIYDIIKKVEDEDNKDPVDDATVRAFTKIDVDGIGEERKKTRKLNDEKVEKQENQDKRAKHGILHKILNPMRRLLRHFHRHRRHSHSKQGEESKKRE